MEARYRRRVLSRLQRPSPEKPLGYAELNDDVVTEAITINETETDDNNEHHHPPKQHEHHGGTFHENYQEISDSPSDDDDDDDDSSSKVREKENSGPTAASRAPSPASSSSPLRAMYRMTLGQRNSFRQVDHNDKITSETSRGRDVTPRKSPSARSRRLVADTNHQQQPNNNSSNHHQYQIETASSPLLGQIQASYSESQDGNDAFHNISDIFKAAVDAELTPKEEETTNDFQDPYSRALERPPSRGRNRSRSRSRSTSRPRFHSADETYNTCNELPPIHRMRTASRSPSTTRRASRSPSTSTRQRRYSNPNNLHVQTPQNQPYDERESRRKAERERILRLMNGLDALLIDTPKNNESNGAAQRPPKPMTTTPTSTPNNNGTPIHGGNASVSANSTATTTAQVKAASVQERAKIKNLMQGLDQLLVDTPPAARGRAAVSQFHEHPADQRRPPLSSSGGKERTMIPSRYQNHHHSHHSSSYHQPSYDESLQTESSDARTVHTSSTGTTSTHSSSSGTHTTGTSAEAKTLPTTIRAASSTNVSAISSRGTSLFASSSEYDKSSVSTPHQVIDHPTNDTPIRTMSTMEDLKLVPNISSSSNGINTKPSEPGVEMRLNNLTPRSQVTLMIQRSHSGSLEDLSARDPSRSPAVQRSVKEGEVVPKKLLTPKKSGGGSNSANDSTVLAEVLKEQEANQLEAKLRHHTQFIPMDPSVPLRDVVARQDERRGFSTKESIVSALTATTTMESSSAAQSQRHNTNTKNTERGECVDIPECHQAVSEITTMSTQKSCDETAASWNQQEEAKNVSSNNDDVGFKSPTKSNDSSHNNASASPKADNEKFMKSPPGLNNEGTQVTMKTSYSSGGLKNEGSQVTMKTSYSSGAATERENMKQRDDYVGPSLPGDATSSSDVGDQKYPVLKWNPSDEQAPVKADESLRMPVLLEAMQKYRQRVEANHNKDVPEDGDLQKSDHPPSNSVLEQQNQEELKSSHEPETAQTARQDGVVVDPRGPSQDHQVKGKNMDLSETPQPSGTGEKVELSSESKSHERAEKKSGNSALDHALLAVAKPPVPATSTRETIEPPGSQQQPYLSVRDRIKAFSEAASASSPRGRSPSPSPRGRSASPFGRRVPNQVAEPTDKPEETADSMNTGHGSLTTGTKSPSTCISSQGVVTDNEAELQRHKQDQQNSDSGNGTQGTIWTGSSTGLPPLAASSNNNVAPKHGHVRQNSAPAKISDLINKDKGTVGASSTGTRSVSSHLHELSKHELSHQSSHSMSYSCHDPVNVAQRQPLGQADHESNACQVPGALEAMENNYGKPQERHSEQASMSGQVTIHPYSNANYGPPPPSYGIQSQQSVNSQSHMEGGHLMSTGSAPHTPVYHQQQAYASHQPFNSPGQQSQVSYMMPPPHPNHQSSNGNMCHPQPPYYHTGGNGYQPPQSPGLPPPRGYYRPGSQPREGPAHQTSTYQAHHGAVVHPSESTGSYQPRQQNFPQHHRLEVRTASGSAASPSHPRKVLARSIESQEAQFHHGTNEIMDKSLASTPVAKTKHSRYHRGGKFLDEPVHSRGSHSYVSQVRDPSPSRRPSPRREIPPTPNERNPPEESSRRTPKRGRSRSKRLEKNKTPANDDDNTIAGTTITNGSDRSPTYSSGGSSFEDEDDDDRTTGPSFSQNVMGMFDGFQLPSFTNCIASTKGVVDNMVLGVERSCIKPPEMPKTSKREKKRERRRKSSTPALASTIRRASSSRSQRRQEPDGQHYVV